MPRHSRKKTPCFDNGPVATINRDRSSSLKDLILNTKPKWTSIPILFVITMFAGCGSGGGASDGLSGGAPNSPSGGAPVSGTVTFSDTFPTPGPLRSDPDPVNGFSNDGKWYVEQKAAGRAVVVNVGRDGGTALRLHTEPGDSDVSGSGTNERNDVALAQLTDGVQGREQWWAHSILFPDDFVDLPQNEGGAWNYGSVMNFHDNAGGPTKGPAQLLFYPTGLLYQIYGGDPANPSLSEYPVGPITRGVWYDFVIHLRWSSEADGFYRVWLNGRRVFQHTGPTLYRGSGVYLKLANYHSPFGQSSSVIHDRVIRGTTAQAVSLTPLEGVVP